MKKIKFYEPWFFILFGVFHLHRIWGLIDRKSYADFWIGTLESRNAFYYGLMIILAVLCILGIVSFFQNIRHNYWWRFIYIAGGSYLLFDLFAICVRLEFWNKLLLWMFDTTSPYWNVIWSGFILLGGFVFCLGIKLLIGYLAQNDQEKDTKSSLFPAGKVLPKVKKAWRQSERYLLKDRGHINELTNEEKKKIIDFFY